MKKIFALILTFALALTAASVPAFAADTDTIGKGGSAVKDVKATYSAGDSATIVYSVDITWGEMSFTYNDGAWDPDTHKYDASWSSKGNTVTVTNHSNTAVTAKLSYTAADNYTDIAGKFEKGELNLATAVGTDISNAPHGSDTLTVSGALSSETPADTVIGTVTVTLN